MDNKIYIQYNTKNLSAIKLYQTLKGLGVKNNKFHLALYDKDLMDVDPFSHNLTELQCLKIYTEIMRNKYYFLREIVRIPVAGDNVPYEFNLANLTLSFLKTYNMNTVLVIPRQFGKTTSEVIDDIYVYDFATINNNTLYLNKSHGDAKSNLQTFKEIRLAYPEWLKTYVFDPKDIDNQIEKKSHKRKNRLAAKASPTNEATADKTGRGMTVANIYFDEFAFIKFNRKIYNAAAPAWSKASEMAKEHGVPYGKTITTTPNNIDDPSGSYCKEVIIDKAAPWRITMFDFSEEQLKLYVVENSDNNFIYVTYTYIELGRDQKWFEAQVRDLAGDTAAIAREVLLEWPLSSNNGAFNEDELRTVKQFVLPVYATLQVGTYLIDLYEPLDMLANYIVTCDPSGGLNQDFSAVLICAPDDFRVVGAFKNSRIDTTKLQNLLSTLCTKYLPNSILIVENNNYGLPILNNLATNRLLEPRLYGDFPEDVAMKQTKNGIVQRPKRNKFKYGVCTDSASRKLMMDLLYDIVRQGANVVTSPLLYSDISTLRVNRNKIEAASGAHDDVVMSYLIMRYAIYYGSCMQRKFKIAKTPTSTNLRGYKSASLNEVSPARRLSKVLNSDQPTQAKANITAAMARQADINKQEDDIGRPIMTEQELELQTKYTETYQKYGVKPRLQTDDSSYRPSTNKGIVKLINGMNTRQNKFK